MGACTECRAAKVKCEFQNNNNDFPCLRCRRLGKECVPHQSKQGQGRRCGSNKKRRRQERSEDFEVDSQPSSLCAPQEESMKASSGEANAIACHMIGDPTVTKNHYGLRHLVRSWVALALKRRSFELWSKAGNLAVRCGMSMDDILCEQEVEEDGNAGMSRQRGMDFLHPFLLTPTEEQKVIGSPLGIHDIPTSLWRSIGIAQDDQVEGELQNRWISVREVNRGVSRFYVSPGFASNIVTRELIEETYRANQIDIVELFLAKERSEDAAQDVVRGVSHQLALHSKPGMVTKPTRMSNIRIHTRTASSGDTEIRTVDQLWCFIIPDLDRSFGLTEFIAPPDGDNHENVSEEAASLQPESLWVGIDDIDVEADDFKLIYDFLKIS